MKNVAIIGMKFRKILIALKPFGKQLRKFFQARNVFTFGGAKRSGSDRECKYFPIGMNAREPLWR